MMRSVILSQESLRVAELEEQIWIGRECTDKKLEEIRAEVRQNMEDNRMILLDAVWALINGFFKEKGKKTEVENVEVSWS